MISQIIIRFFLWFGIKVLGFKYLILKHDGTQTSLDGVTFCYSEEYAKEVESLSLANHRKDYE